MTTLTLESVKNPEHQASGGGEMRGKEAGGLALRPEIGAARMSAAVAAGSAPPVTKPKKRPPVLPASPPSQRCSGQPSTSGPYVSGRRVARNGNSASQSRR